MRVCFVFRPTVLREHLYILLFGRDHTVSPRGHMVRLIFYSKRASLRNGKAYQLQTWYTDGERKPVSSTGPWPPVTKVKVARSRDAPDRCWPIRRERNVLETQKYVGRLHHKMITSFKIKGQRLRSPGRLMLRQKLRHIFERKGLRTGNSVHSWSMKSRITGSAIISKVKGHGDEVTWCVWQVLDHNRHSRERKVPETVKLLAAHATNNKAHQLQGEKVKGQGYQTHYYWDRKCIISTGREGLYEL